MFITKINYITCYLKYKGIDAVTRAIDMNMEIRDLRKFKNKDRFNSIQIILQYVGFYGK